MQCDLEAFGNETFPQVLDALTSAEKRIGDVLIFPIRTLGIGFEQNIGSPDFLRGALKFFDNIETGLSFVVSQSDNVSVLHGELPCEDNAKR